MARMTLRVYSAPGALVGTLSEWSNLTITRRLNAPGAIQLELPLGTAGATMFNREHAYVVPVLGGVERDDVYVLDDDTDTDTDLEGPQRTLKVLMPSLWVWLDTAIVYGSGATPAETGAAIGGVKPEHKFDDATPGKIMKILIDRAHARGAIPHIGYDFTWTHDSAGVAWPETYDETYKMGTSLQALLDGMIDSGWVDARTHGFTLQMFVPDTALNVDRPNAVLQRGHDVQDAPRKRKRLGSRTTMLVQGDLKTAYEAVNAAGVTALGRREGYYSRGGVTATNTLRKLADYSLRAKARVSEGVTITYSPYATSIHPDVSYGIGDRIRYSTRRQANGSLEPLRVRTLTEVWQVNGEARYEVEVNDMFGELSDRLTQLLEGLRQGDNPTPTLPPTYPALPMDPIDWPDDVWDDIQDGVDGTPGAGGMVRIWIQPDEPMQARVGDLWYDTDGLSGV